MAHARSIVHNVSRPALRADEAAAAHHFIVVFEAQRDQVERTGIDRIEIVSRIGQISPIDAWIAEAPGILIDWTKPFFTQINTNAATRYINTFNICVTKRR